MTEEQVEKKNVLLKSANIIGKSIIAKIVEVEYFVNIINVNLLVESVEVHQYVHMIK